MKVIRTVWGLVIFTVALFSCESAAHYLGQSYIFISVYDDSIEGRFEITLPDLNRGLNVDFKEDRTATAADLDLHIDAVESYLLDRIRFSVNGRAVSIRLENHELLTLDPAQFATVHFSLAGLVDAPETIEVDYRVLFDVLPEHRGFLVVENNWKTGTFKNEATISLVFAPAEERQTLDLSSSSVLRGFIAMMRLGTHHIWIGIDHILFLLALLLPSVLRREEGKWQPVAGFRQALLNVFAIVTLFTIAHTITLSLAATQTITLPSRLVESVIAISIAVAALDILLPLFKGYIWIVVFAFGLFHGFGFASVLGEIGIPPRYLVHSLLGFNLGVEVGQVAIVCAMFPVLFFARRWYIYRDYLIRAGALVLIIIAMYWFIERAFATNIPLGSILRSLLGQSG